MPRTPTIAVALALLASSFVPLAAQAGHTSGIPAPEDLPGPYPEASDLGFSYNDVREEPSHPDDDNGFPGTHEGDFWSPKDDDLVLDAFVAPGDRLFLGRPVGADVSNILNRALHGSNYEDHERTMFPGTNQFAAWWGWWSDTGGGGDLQNNSVTSQAPFVGPANGAIDDGNDCKNHAWDEFTHRGANDCAPRNGHTIEAEDQMFAFVQPGTHELHFNTLYQTVLSDSADAATRPDFQYVDTGQGWQEPNRPLDVEYDASLLVTTTVTSAVNPEEIGATEDGTTYDPFSPAEGLSDPAADHAVDVDVYTAAHSKVEEAYRTAVWDPGDQADSPLDALHEEGLKGLAKDTIPPARDEAIQAAEDTSSELLKSTERQRGLADDLVAGPYLHEPDTAADDYNGWATHDAATSYGGLDGDYYEPGPDQAYDGYQSGERFWADAKISLNYLPTGITFGFQQQLTPEVPEPGAPVSSTAQEGDDDTQSPGIMYFRTHHGTWHDADGDGWIGDAGADGHPYDNGTVDDPNVYFQDNQGEFRGTCAATIDMTLYPTSDTDGDGTDDWGQAGIYIMGPESNNYGAPWMDVVGGTADPALDPLRNEQHVGDTASFLAPERDRMERYRTQGPVEVESWGCYEDATESGTSDASFWILLPTGSLDFTFEAVTHFELTDEGRTSQHGDNEGTSLTGATVTDVDRHDAILPGSP